MALVSPITGRHETLIPNPQNGRQDSKSSNSPLNGRSKTPRLRGANRLSSSSRMTTCSQDPGGSSYDHDDSEDQATESQSLSQSRWEAASSGSTDDRSMSRVDVDGQKLEQVKPETTAKSSHGSDPLGSPDMMMGMTRSMFTMTQFNAQRDDYTKSLDNLKEKSAEYETALQACHERGANRCVKVAMMHKGLYVKAAQFVASLRAGTGDRAIPKAYTKALGFLVDGAPAEPVIELLPVLRQTFKLGDWPEKPFDKSCTFSDFHQAPIASASVAQVHFATLRSGADVAVKVQHPKVRKQMASDFAVFRKMGQNIKSMAGGHDLMWLIEDFETNLKKELDFRLEAANGELSAKQLAHLYPKVLVPKVFTTLSSEQVLVMEMVHGLIKVGDQKALKTAGLQARDCADLICETFAEMIFVHGRVHADPHGGNVMLRPRSSDGKGRSNPQLVLLDHGLYVDLTDAMRQDFCRYWIACFMKDATTIDELGKKFAGTLYKYMPMVLSPWFIFGGGSRITLKDFRAAARGDLPDHIQLGDVADLVASTRSNGCNLLGVLHALGYVRGLLHALDMPERRRLKIMTKYAFIGLKGSRDWNLLDRGWSHFHLSRLQTPIAMMSPVATVLRRGA